MVSRSLLLVLLVLTCLQSFTMAQSGNGPKKCCFQYQTKPIPAKFIMTFTLKDTRQFCANPSEDWVKNIMNQIDGRLFQ
ncbi:hypothetical protein C0J50_13754 [Silurus asotus]|uniref:Chemokine interleukin-8-like domain-containing protein n=1 Tax=Silurus asotus TaxID=30991 RepID=A0AAD5B2S9_SILAS|nr:hypothetical protein C0J50_13754 [Silurus asotus]